MQRSKSSLIDIDTPYEVFNYETPLIIPMRFPSVLKLKNAITIIDVRISRRRFKFDGFSKYAILKNMKNTMLTRNSNPV